MAIALRTPASAQSGSGTTSSQSLGAMPGDWASGDFALAVSTIGAGSGITANVTGLTSPTVAERRVNTNNTGQLNIFSEVLPSGDVGNTLALTASAARSMAAGALAISGSNGAVESITDGAQVGGTSGVLPSVTPSVDNSLLVGFLSTTGSTAITIPTPPAGWTQQWFVATTNSGTRVALACWTKQLGAGTAGVATGTTAFTQAPTGTQLPSVAVIAPAPAQAFIGWGMPL